MICVLKIVFVVLLFILKALIYPLTVASKSTTTARHNAANKILKNMCEHCNTLVQQAMMVPLPFMKLLLLMLCTSF